MATTSAANAISNIHCRMVCSRRLKIVFTRRSVRTAKPLRASGEVFRRFAFQAGRCPFSQRTAKRAPAEASALMR